MQQPWQFCGVQLGSGSTQRPPLQKKFCGHDSQTWPPPPHWNVFIPAWHTPLKSQHPGQFWGPQNCVIGWHDPKLQVKFGGHWKQNWPPPPHSNCELPDWHTPLKSQHPGQF
jgi:hypothetical protein